MLPEFLDEQADYKAGISAPTSREELQSLRSWLDAKAVESSRQTRPAWLEIIYALLALTEQKLGDEGLVEESFDNPDIFTFETHLIARQVAKQRGERTLPTRFVTDEIKRISSHQLGFIEKVTDGEKLALIGWYRRANRRGLGLSVMEKSDALELYGNEPKHQNLSELAENKSSEGFPPSEKAGGSRLPTIAIVAFFLGALIGMAVVQFAGQKAAQESTLESIMASGLMRCGVDGTLPHFSLRSDVEQKWWGLDVELCRALAAALDVEVNFVKVSSSKFENRIEALLNNEVHILFRNTSHTLERDLNEDILFGPHYFYEQEYFLDLFPSDTSLLIELSDIQGKRICVKPGTSNEASLKHLNLQSDFTIVTQDKSGIDLTSNLTLLRAFRTDTPLCDFVFGNYYVLKQLKADKARRDPEKEVTLRHFKHISLDPLAPVVRQDQQWKDLVSYSIYALLYAEKIGIYSYNVEEKYASGDAFEKDFLRGESMIAQTLSKDWVYRIIARTGNYGEIYYRSIICGYVACKMPSEKEFYALMDQLNEERWPNKPFNEIDPKPGMLLAPRF